MLLNLSNLTIRKKLLSKSFWILADTWFMLQNIFSVTKRTSMEQSSEKKKTFK